MTSVVILPGLDGTTALLDAFCARLEALGVAARAIAYPVDRPMGYDALEPLVREALPVAEPFVLVGESFSGPLAIRIAADPPTGLAGLVLSTTFARAPVPLLSPLASLVRFAPGRPPLALLSWVLLGRWATPQLREGLTHALRAVTPDVLRTRAAETLRVDASDVLGAIRVPVLQLVARNDRLLGASTWKELAARIPVSRTVQLPGPHLLLQTATEDAAQAISAFAREVGREPVLS